MSHAIDVESVWRVFHERLGAFIRRRVPGGADADDVLQEVFLRVHANRDRLAETENASAWLHRIAINSVADHYRRRARMPGPATDGDVPEPDTAPGPGTELASCLEPFAQALPEPYREAILLTEFEGLTQAAAAERAGVSLSAMKSRVHRGREKLRRLVLDCCHVELDRRGGVAAYERRVTGSSGCGCDRP